MMHKILLVEPNNNYFDEEALTKPLGGSETALLFMIRALKKRSDCELDVFFRDSGDFKEFVSGKSYDLVLAYRSPAPLFQVRGKINAVFFQDLPNEFAIGTLQVLIQQGKIDRLIFLSHFQKGEFIKQLPTLSPERQSLMLENGIDLKLFDKSIQKENAFIYASAPNRGLDILLKMWPQIHTQLPEYKLKVAGSVKMYNVGGNEEAVNEQREELLSVGKELYDQNIEGVEWLGGLNHSELVREIEKCKALLYPSTFIETSCHILNCCLHAGTSPVTSQLGALVEKICNGENGIIIPGDPASSQFQDMYIRSVVESTRSGTLDRMNNINRGSYSAWDYERLADRMIGRLLEYEELEGYNQKILGVCCSLRGNSKRNFSNIRWYAPYDMQVEEVVGMPIDQARNVAGSLTVYKKADWLLLIDDDIYVYRTFLNEMMERALKNDVDVVVANYYYKDNDMLVPVARVARKSDNRAMDISSFSETQVNSDKYRFVMSGLGACLISTYALQKIGRPFFRTQSVQPKHLGEDSYFFQECQRLGIRIWLALDIPVIHAGDGRFYGKEEHIQKIVPSLVL